MEMMSEPGHLGEELERAWAWMKRWQCTPQCGGSVTERSGVWGGPIGKLSRNRNLGQTFEAEEAEVTWLGEPHLKTHPVEG